MYLGPGLLREEEKAFLLAKQGSFHSPPLLRLSRLVTHVL